MTVFYTVVIWYKNLDRPFIRFVAIHAFDAQTDKWTDRRTDLIDRPRLHSMQRGKNKTTNTECLMSYVLFLY